MLVVDVAKVTIMALHLQALLPPRLVVRILPIVSQAALESHSRVKRNLFDGVSEAAVVEVHIGVAPSSVRLIAHRSRDFMRGCELFCSVWRPINVGQKVARFLLLPGLVHLLETALVVVNVRVTTLPILPVRDAVEVSIEGRLTRFTRRRGLVTKLAEASLVLIDRVHRTTIF